MRKKILSEVENLIFNLIDRAEARQYQSKNVNVADPHKTRVAYVNSLANLLKAYNQLLKDSELEEIEERIKELEKEMVK